MSPNFLTFDPSYPLGKILGSSPVDVNIKQAVLEARAANKFYIHVNKQWFEQARGTFRALIHPLASLFEDAAYIKSLGVRFIIDPKITDPTQFYITESERNIL